MVSDWSSDVCSSDLVGCEQPFASCDHGRGGFGKEISVHETVLLLDGEGKPGGGNFTFPAPAPPNGEIGRASCRERVEGSVVAGAARKPKLDIRGGR